MIHDRWPSRLMTDSICPAARLKTCGHNGLNGQWNDMDRSDISGSWSGRGSNSGSGRGRSSDTDRISTGSSSCQLPEWKIGAIKHSIHSHRIIFTAEHLHPTKMNSPRQTWYDCINEINRLVGLVYDSCGTNADAALESMAIHSCRLQPPIICMSSNCNLSCSGVLLPK